MLTDLIQSIYTRMAQVGVSIKELNKSLEDLNKNIDQKISDLSEKMSQFSHEIKITQTKHIDVIKDIGENVTRELKSVQEELGLEAIKTLIASLENFGNMAEEVLNEETVNLILSEAIESVKLMKNSLKYKEPEEATNSG